MSKSIKPYLKDIIQLADYLINTFASKTRGDLYSDPTLQFAVSYVMQHIGEAANKIPDAFRQQHPQIQWRKIINLRHRLAHNYTGTSYSLIYDIIKESIPLLKNQVEEILKTLPEEN